MRARDLFSARARRIFLVCSGILASHALPVHADPQEGSKMNLCEIDILKRSVVSLGDPSRLLAFRKWETPREGGKDA